MNPYLNAYNQYRATAVTTAGPEKLLLMLYDGLIIQLKRSRETIEKHDYPAAHQTLIKAQEIVNELIATLKMDYEIARNLYQLYDYMNRRLIAANIKKDSAAVDEVLELAVELRSSWAEAAKKEPPKSIFGDRRR